MVTSKKRPHGANATTVEGSFIKRLGFRPLASFILSIIGLCISAYLTYAHFAAGVTLACPQTATFNCEKVTTSAQSYVFGIPVALLGLIYFAVALIVMYPQTWKVTSKYVAFFRIGLVLAGMGFVIYLISQELLVIKAICLWCTSVHIVQFLLFLITITGFYDTGYGANLN